MSDIETQLSLAREENRVLRKENERLRKGEEGVSEPREAGDYRKLVEEALAKLIEPEAPGDPEEGYKGIVASALRELEWEKEELLQEVWAHRARLIERVEETKLEPMTAEEAKKWTRAIFNRATGEESQAEAARLREELERRGAALREVKRLAPQLHSYAFGQNRYADEVLLQIGEIAGAALSPGEAREEGRSNK